MSAEPNITNKHEKTMQTIIGYVRSIGTTIVVLVFVVNSLILSLFAFDVINPPSCVLMTIGIISLLFSSIILGVFVHLGVDNKVNHKRRK